MILLDSDGVAANFHGGVSRYVPWDEFREFSPELQENVVREIYLKEPEFFRNLEPNPQFIELLKFAKESGEGWMICTAAGSSHPNYQLVANNKRDWFKEHFDVDAKDIIVTKDSPSKLAYATPHNILADDFPDNCQAFINAGGHAVVVEPNTYNPNKVILELEKRIEIIHSVDHGIGQFHPAPAF